MNATEIIPGLWQGGELLPLLPTGWDAVIDCRAEAEDLRAPLFGAGVKTFVWAPMVDGPDLPDDALLRYLLESVARWQSSGWKTLVHCAAGLNRSALVVGCYLRTLSYSGPDAVALIQQKRPGSLNNEVFRQKVLTYVWSSSPEPQKEIA